MKKGYHILEIANVHGGDFDYFKKIIQDISSYKSPEFGVKLQVLKPDLIALPDFSYYDLYHKLCFDLEQWDEIISLAGETKDVWIDVFDLYGVEIIEKFTSKIYGVKFQASVLDNLEIFEALSKIDISDKYLMINISGIPENQIQDKLDIIEKYINCKEVIIQMGYQSYPTSVDKSGLGKIEVLKNKFDNKIIYADHTDGKNNDAKITAGLGKKDGDRVVGSGFRAADELGMMLAGTLKPATSRFCHGMVSKQWLKQHRSTQKRDIGQLG